MKIKQYTTLSDHIALAQKILAQYANKEICASTVKLAHSRNRAITNLSPADKAQYTSDISVIALDKIISDYILNKVK